MVEGTVNSNGACITIKSMVHLVRGGYSSVALPISYQQSNSGGLAAQIAEKTQGNDQSEDIIRDDPTEATQFGAVAQAQIRRHTTGEATMHRRRSSCVQFRILDRSRTADHRVLQGHQKRQDLREIHKQSRRSERRYLRKPLTPELTGCQLQSLYKSRNRRRVDDVTPVNVSSTFTFDSFNLFPEN